MDTSVADTRGRLVPSPYFSAQCISHWLWHLHCTFSTEHIYTGDRFEISWRLYWIITCVNASILVNLTFTRKTDDREPVAQR